MPYMPSTCFDMIPYRCLCPGQCSRQCADVCRFYNGDSSWRLLAAGRPP